MAFAARVRIGPHEILALLGAGREREAIRRATLGFTGSSL